MPIYRNVLQVSPDCFGQKDSQNPVMHCAKPSCCTSGCTRAKGSFWTPSRSALIYNSVWIVCSSLPKVSQPCLHDSLELFRPMQLQMSSKDASASCIGSSQKAALCLLGRQTAFSTWLHAHGAQRWFEQLLQMPRSLYEGSPRGHLPWCSTFMVCGRILTNIVNEACNRRKM